MKPTREEFLNLKNAHPGTVLIFEDEGRYLFLGFDAVLAGQTLLRRTTKVHLTDRMVRALYIPASDLSAAVGEIKQRHFKIKVEVIE